MTHPLDTSSVYDALRQSIYDLLAHRVRPMRDVVRETKQEMEPQDDATSSVQEVER